MNRLAKALADGRVAYGMGHFSGCASLVEIASHAGFDFIYIDMHQAPLGFETVQMLATTADACGITALVRVSDFDPTSINLALNSGARGVVIPHVDSLEMALDVVAATRYPPRGTRGACPSIRAAGYSAKPWREHFRKSDEETQLVLLLEDVKGFEAIEKIAAVDGVDALLLGPFDLSQELGFPDANWRHPEMRKMLKRAVAACRKNGVKVWTTTTSYMQPDYVADLREAGVDMISFCTDEVIFYQACHRLIEQQSLAYPKEAARLA